MTSFNSPIAFIALLLAAFVAVLLVVLIEGRD
jgi:hypothetical protein